MVYVRLMTKRAEKMLTILLFLILSTRFSTVLALDGSPIVSETLTLTVYLDGFVLISHELWINHTYPTITVSMLTESFENLVIVDNRDLPLEYSISNGSLTVYSLGANQVNLSYFTQDLTSKTGKYWTLQVEVTLNATFILPENASIISLNKIPELIESFNDKVVIIMPPGLIEITYIPAYSIPGSSQGSEVPWPLIAVVGVLLSIFVLVIIIWYLKQKKMKTAENAEETVVDLEKLFGREKHLRKEEIQVIHLLAEKNGIAFEAELYEKLDLPRTTTWRLLKRLETMEIVDIRKSRRQNIVSIKRKYLKKK